jgi:hypothetical protein
MKEIGLQPPITGEPGGKETGQTVSHYIIPGGRYAKASAKLKAKGFQLHWQSANVGDKRRGREGGEAAKLLIILVELARIEFATS